MGPTLDAPNVNPDRITPPAHVITYTDAQLEQIRGTVLAEGPLGRSDYQYAVAMRQDEPPTDAAGHNPFALERINQSVDHSTRNSEPDAGPKYQLPPAIQRFVDNQHETETDNLAHAIHMNKIDSDLGVARLDQTNIFKLQSMAPERATQTAVKYMDNALFGISRAGGMLPGLSQSQTAEVFRLRDEYRSPSSGLSPEQIQENRSRYEQLSKDYMVGNVYGAHNALAVHALRGFEPKKTAAELYALTHPERAVTDEEKKIAALSPEERQKKLVDIIGNTPREGLDAVMREYSTIPLKAAAKDLYTAIQKGDMDALRTALGPRSPRECEQLIVLAEEHAKANGLPSPTSVVYSYSDEKKRDDFIHLMRGFDAHESATAVYAAYNQKFLGLIPDINEGELQRAFGVIKGPDGKPATCYTAEQVTAIREALKGVATEQTKGMDEAKRAAYFKGVEEECVGKFKAALDNPAKTKPEAFTAVFANDAKAVGLDPDTTVGSISSSMAYGFGATQGAMMLHQALERYDASKPTAEADAKIILDTLRFGPESQRTKHLDVPMELAPLIQAHDGMYVNADRSLNQSLRAGIEKKLTGDVRIQALQIIDQGFYADLEASKLDKDLTLLPGIVAGVKDRKQLLDRIDQVDKEFRLAHGGKGLIEAIEESKLPPAKKAELQMIAGLPRAISLHDELAKEKPDTAALEALLKTPRIEEIYAATYRPQAVSGPGNLRVDLENSAAQGRISHDFVVQQELKLSGLAPDTITKLNAEVDANNPTIGSKTSVLRGLKPEQLAVVEHLYDFAEVGRATARGDSAVGLRDRIYNLMQDGKISEDRAVRAGMSLSGKDVWNLADGIDKNRASALSTLGSLSPVEIAQVRDVYREDRGELLLHAVINDASIESKFANKGEYTQWLDKLGDTLYGPGVKDLVIQADGGMGELKAASTDEQKQAAMQKLQGALETAAGAGAMKNVREMYNSYFGDKNENRLKLDLDDLVTKGSITKEQHEYLLGMLDQK